MSTTNSILSRLSEIRTNRSRLPQEVFQFGQELIETGWINTNSSSNSNEGWLIKEQLAIASIECGQFELAKVLIDRLSFKFPKEKSQRITSLQGLYLEGKGDLKSAQGLYNSRLGEKESDVLIRKRLISLHLSTPLTATRTTNNDSKDLSRQEGIKLLIDYLDSYYIDAEGWLLLSKTYSELGLFKQALDCSSHSILIQPQNCFLLLYHAELNFTLGGESYETALKEFLRVIEMSTDLNEQPRLIGCGRRAAFGAKTCISRLLLFKTSPSSSTTTTFSDSKLRELEIMLTRLLLASYQGSSTNREGLKTVREWLEK